MSVKRKILKLDPTLVNQIAAGEVVENPSSIVKELMENSIDAGSKVITIDILQGGLELIRVEDDGFGMGPEDALLSIERHATSKIRSLEDFHALTSLGFRGEALAAISSVSRFELKTSDGQEATRVTLTHSEPCARNQGTTIEVRNLFYNVPARKKFQKSPAACASQVRKVVETVAMAHPDIAFSLNGQVYLPTDLKRRIEEILGEHEHELKAKNLYGLFASPSKAGPTRGGQTIYLNRRPIYSPLLSRAVKEAFATRIGVHEHPRFILFLELPPSEVDVNVHPQKKEVRFRDEGNVFRMVRNAIQAIFAGRGDTATPLSFTEPVYNFSETFPTPHFKVEETGFEFVYSDRGLAVILGRFLLVEREKPLFIDLKAAHARLFFESLIMQSPASQVLMVPIEIELKKEEEELAEQLGELGIECRLLKRRLVVDALPPFLEEKHFFEFFQKFLEGKPIEEITTRLIQASPKRYSFEEGMQIWQKVKECKDFYYDPKGNPIFVKICEIDMERFMENHGKIPPSKAADRERH
ncbi:MAG: hypothetical protein A2796_00525 [Chlamydiae bacterium RIFCSPHIGHO2_01_FULL_44_39]|nr:MAG: hypothetical protein A2796_00525 [Chlamydiae bacterium RIFCSPHIGHO2_01_FULL_44_39]OGN66559.1 MAG: hypothetical protein A2978_05135 [Chlamydiae bacterium RIFCSPLOWO2_01_FULL_44_52]OGN70348.1 MAG: hypothetical protein A3F79_00260 [Chlamydiae bacterium RIFCSPLOWO2_12_FULL_45_20]